MVHRSGRETIRELPAGTYNLAVFAHSSVSNTFNNTNFRNAIDVVLVNGAPACRSASCLNSQRSQPSNRRGLKMIHPPRQFSRFA